MDCIFCKIINKEISSEIIYEDERFLSFIDINPVNFGHVLVIPKQHSENIMYMDDGLASGIFVVVKQVASAVKLALNCDGINIGMNNFEAAGQVVMHSHIHIIPRFYNDGLKSWDNKKYEDLDQMREFGEKIRQFLK